VLQGNAENQPLADAVLPGKITFEKKSAGHLEGSRYVARNFIAKLAPRFLKSHTNFAFRWSTEPTYTP